MFYKWGLLSYRFRRIVPAVIVLVILALYALAGTKLEDRMSQEGWDDPGSSSTKAAQIELDTFGRDNNGDVILLFESTSDRPLDDPATVDKARSFLTQLQEQHPEQISHINSYFDNRNDQLATADKHLAFAAVGLKGDGEQTLKDFRAVGDDFTPPEHMLGEDVKVEVAGATAIADALDKGMSSDIKRAELVALPLVGVLLLIVFGSLVAAVMPLIVGILSILGSLGVLSVLAGITQVNVFAMSVVTLLGLGLAIDYGLFMVSRFREEMDSGRDVRDAVAITTATAGQTVVFSAAMVAVALSGLLVFPQAFLKSIAYGAISAVGLAAILSITVLPSLFGMLGPNINKLRVRSVSKKKEDIDSSLWARLAGWSMRHAKAVTLGVTGLLIALTIPLGGVSFGGINETYLPPTNDVRQTQASFDKNFPQYRTEPIKLVVTGADNAGLVSIYQQASQIDGLTGRFTPSSPTENGTTVLSAGIEDRSQNKAVVDQLRDIDTPDGVELYIGGTPALEIESIEALFDRLPWMALYIIAATFILMSIVFGSIILPAKAVIMTILTLGTTLGVLTWMFVDGLGASLFNFTPGPLMSPILVLISAIVYGLSTDYEVFLVSRMVESRARGATTDQAIRYGTAHTGSIITAAALIMIVVCGAFGFSDIVMMKYIAFGMIAALLLDATIVRMFLVPAVMHLLREDSWWAPSWVKRASNYVGHGKEPLPAAVAPTTAGRNDYAEATEPGNVEVYPEDLTVRSGTPAEDDNQLIPFHALMARLQSEQQGEHGRGSATKGD
ncbi:Membrane protein YdfJ [Corynebacterium ciconiae DSM 44920]|uniref:MMPL family transporter n=1 Tax=Corynebacterium ciconiae TaxID=227319 RepID=UPI000371D502|nr:MMPL family transporter [Corynebacterium ciconiae]WKD60250.1 Membrane protein YdfJ [Corynebacterium ciconiae DSM 44920]